MNVFSGNPPEAKGAPVEFSVNEIAALRLALKVAAGTEHHRNPLVREANAKLMLVHSLAVDAGMRAGQLGFARARMLGWVIFFALAVGSLVTLAGCGGGDDFQSPADACAQQAAAVAAQRGNGPVTTPTTPLAGCTQ